MKKSAYILFIIFLNIYFYGLCYSQSESSSLVPYLTDTNIKEGTVFLGINLNLGISKPNQKIISDSNTKPGPSFELSGKFFFFFSDFGGLIVDGGVKYQKIEEKKNELFVEYDLIYTFINFAPFIRYKRFYLSTGAFFGFLVFAKTSTNEGKNISTKQFNIFDLGVSFSTGFILGNPVKTLYNIGIDIKYQLNNIKKNQVNGTQIFSIHLSFGILFGTKVGVR